MCIQENSVHKESCEYMFELATLEINAIWRMQYFFQIQSKYNSM